MTDTKAVLPELPQTAYQVLVEQSHAAIFVVQHNRCVYANPQLSALLGYSRGELEDMQPERLPRRPVPGEAGKTDTAFDMECIRKDGSRLRVQVWEAPIQWGLQAAHLITVYKASAVRPMAQGSDQQAVPLEPADVSTTTSNEETAQGSHLAIEQGLRHALETQSFELRYQPKLDLITGAVIGLEVLLEWNAAERPAASRVEFIRIAEETGLIVPIGEWVLRAACIQARAWQRAGLHPLRVAVNMSPRQLQQPDIVARIQAILVETGLDPRQLGLEITEGVLAGENIHVKQVLTALKALGIELSLDDFGTGYSSLNYLRTLPIDVVKVDRSFVHDVTAAAQDVSMTRAIITLAHSLQKKVLAVGVETEGQLALLIANQCDQMQGYYFSKPLPAAELEALLGERRGLPEHLLLRRARQRTLLLVDDEESVVSSLKRLLRREGYNIVTANSGAQGLQRLAEHAVDVIVSDQRMPGMTGVEFLRRAKQLYPETVRLVLSGYTELQSITDAINEGAIYKFLTKPWEDERLRAHIAEAFLQKELADENHRLGSALTTANRDLSAMNERLEQLLASQREQIHREENSLGVARDVLDNIPAALLGIDLEGMVAFANADAEDLLGQITPLIGQDAVKALPPDLARISRGADGHSHCVDLGGIPYRAICRAIGGESHSRGKLLILTPASPLE